MLQATVQSYFAINDAQDTIAEKQSQTIVANRFMSYGTFHTFVKPTMRYGVVFGGTFKGMQMDIDRLMRAGVATDNDRTKLANFNASQGARQSANEHLVPEQLFDDPKTTEKEVEGVSAVKALQIAQQQGQTIYSKFNRVHARFNQVLPMRVLIKTAYCWLKSCLLPCWVLGIHATGGAKSDAIPKSLADRYGYRACR